MNYDGEDLKLNELAYGIGLLILKAAICVAVPVFIIGLLAVMLGAK